VHHPTSAAPVPPEPTCASGLGLGSGPGHYICLLNGLIETSFPPSRGRNSCRQKAKVFAIVFLRTNTAYEPKGRWAWELQTREGIVGAVSLIL
jgi:hypothetical protein